VSQFCSPPPNCIWSMSATSLVRWPPHVQDFLDISNPKAVLERTLRGYSCLTKGDTICLPYNNKKYFIDVIEAKPKVLYLPPLLHTPCTSDPPHAHHLPPIGTYPHTYVFGSPIVHSHGQCLGSAKKRLAKKHGWIVSISCAAGCQKRGF